MNYTPVQFSKEHNTVFYKTLKSRVNAYFKENNMESQYQSIKLKILAIAKNAGREEQIKKMLND